MSDPTSRDDRPAPTPDDPDGTLSASPPTGAPHATAASGAEHGAADVESDAEPDVERLHRAILREPSDPEEGRERVPVWVWAGVVLALFWGGWYLGRFGGEFGAATHVAFRGAGDIGPAAQVVNPAEDPLAAGESIYSRNCQSCHQAGGTGVAGVFPPLVNSEWVSGDPSTIVRILLYGLQGPIEVNGEVYSGIMPAWRDQLTPEEIAAVSTYVRAFGGQAGEPVSPALVTAIRDATERTTAWTAEELRAAEAAGPVAPAAGAGGTATDTTAAPAGAPAGAPGAGASPAATPPSLPAPRNGGPL